MKRQYLGDSKDCNPQRWRARLQRYAQHFGQIATAGRHAKEQV